MKHFDLYKIKKNKKNGFLIVLLILARKGSKVSFQARKLFFCQMAVGVPKVLILRSNILYLIIVTPTNNADRQKGELAKGEKENKVKT